MKRREFLKKVGYGIASATFVTRLRAAEVFTNLDGSLFTKPDPALVADWLARWEKNILNDARTRYCDHETGEEIGWLISPFLNGFYYGYQATRDIKWMEMLVDWADSWIKRGITEPDGYIGWPKIGTGGIVEEDFFTDSLVGEAMGLRPLVLASGDILKTPALEERFGARAEAYLKLAGQMFEKWVARGCWREVKDGGVWVVPAVGIDRQSGKWTQGYERRHSEGFSHPDNKQNLIACWLISLHDTTGKLVYREHAEKWWRVMKSRMRTHEDGKYFVWDYWDPAGPWDFNADGSPQHWIGVHPNGGYYETDVTGIVTAFEHRLVFTNEDLHRLIATNRDFMWNHQIVGAKFQRIDGGQPDLRWKNSPGLLWTWLTPYDGTLMKIFLANHNPASWGGLAVTPWFLTRCAST